MAFEGVNRRRGQRPPKKVLSLAFVAIILLLIAVVAALLLAASLGSSSTHLLPDGVKHGDLDNRKVVTPADENKHASQNNNGTPPSTTLIECHVSTPGDPSNSAANGPIRITVRHDLSPIASDIFVSHVKAKYFDKVFIFRVLKGFIAQWGFHHKDRKVEGEIHVDTPAKTQDVIVEDQTLSNVRGTLSFAGGNPATQQVFVNFGDNKYLDKENSRPFATVDETSMVNVLDKLHMGYKDGQGQIKTLDRGEEATRQMFPNMSVIDQCRVLVSAK